MPTKLRFFSGKRARVAESKLDSRMDIYQKKVKKDVAVSEAKIQERSRRRGRLSSSHFLAGKCSNLGRDSISCCRKIGEEFSSSVEICRKTFPARNFTQPQPSLRDKKSMAMAMFKRKFARTILDTLRAPHIKMWGFEAKRARKLTRTLPRTLPYFFHYHAFFFPDSRVF